MGESSLERIYPVVEGNNETIAGFDTVKLHLERYHFAGKYLQAGNIADIACGAGYGSFLLATEYTDSVNRITAIDNNADAISYAKKNYSRQNINFIESDVFAYKTSKLFNTIISLETIEHLPCPATFIKHCADQLISGGYFIVSAPVVPTKDANPFHLHDFTPSSFRKLFKKAGFSEKHSFIQIQYYNLKELRREKEGRSKGVRKGLAGYYLKNPSKFLLRLFSLLKDGFTIKYLVVFFEKNKL